MSEARPRVVVAEDDETILELLRTRLELDGYAVCYARDGYAAIEVIRSFKPAAVVLDLNMPGLDGFGVLKALGRMAIAAPVLVLTARHAAEDVQRCLALGAKDFLVKPFNDTEFLRRVARMTRRRPV